MSGDYSRHRFDPNKDYSGVLMQQGRVQLDADWNEQIEIQDRRLRAETADLLGRCGVPLETADGFKIDISTNEPQKLSIGRGRIYVDGLLAENHSAGSDFDALLAELRDDDPLPYDKQPYLHDLPGLPDPSDGPHLIYLDLWQREVTFLKDPDLVEIAVGVDTTTRLQTVWQVRLLEIAESVTCTSEIKTLPDAPQHSGGRLSTGTIDVDLDQGPCVIPPSGGFRGLENRLYRVEIHDPGPQGTATFKWSDNNAVLTTAVTAINTLTELKVETTRKDSMLQFKEGDWVELTDDAKEFALEPGVMLKIATVNHGTGTITLVDALDGGEFALGPIDAHRHLRLRRWRQRGQIKDAAGDVIGDVDDSDGVIPVPAAADAVSIQLSDGVIVTFGIDAHVGDEFRVGDYWNFAARTADASVEQLSSAPPRGIHHHYCRLALLEHELEKWVATDWRSLFPPLTSLTQLQYVGGDGQEMMPPTTDLQWLCSPLQVRVVNGGNPVKGALVRFEITESSAPPGVTALLANLDGTDPDVQLSVPTNDDGLAACLWRLDQDASRYCQKVTATLVECDDPDHPEVTIAHQKIEFGANLSLASEVANITNCAVLGENPTVQEALDKLCENTALYYVGGDGQEGNAGETLCEPLEVRVANGRYPAVDGSASVLFKIRAGDGGELIGGNGEIIVDVVGGLASCQWQLGVDKLCQQVEANLVGVDGLPVHFNARLSDIANPRIRVEKVVLLGTTQLLQNDTAITLDQLTGGIGVNCDGAIDPETIKRPTCYVTLEDPTLVERIFDNDVFGSAYVPLVLSSELTVSKNQITWRPTDLAKHLLNRLNFSVPVLARLTIKGNFVWGVQNGDEPRSYLDGDTLGFLDSKSSDAFGNPAIGVLLPSGDRRRGGDFEMWFWIEAKPQTVPNVLMDLTLVEEIDVRTLFLDNYENRNPSQSPSAQFGDWDPPGGATVQSGPPGPPPPGTGNYLQFIAERGEAIARFEDTAQGAIHFSTHFLVPSDSDRFSFRLENKTLDVGFNISVVDNQLSDVGGMGILPNLPTIKADTWYELTVDYDTNANGMIVTLTVGGVIHRTDFIPARPAPRPTHIVIGGPPDTPGDASSRVTLSRTTLDFGERATNATARTFFRVTNTSDEPITLEGFDFDNASFSTNLQPLTIQPGKFARVRVNFRPTAAGSSKGKLTIRTDKGLLTVNLLGSGQLA